MCHDWCSDCTMNFTKIFTRDYLLKLLLLNLYYIPTWITSLESWYRGDSTKVCLRVVILKIYSKIILEIITRIVTGLFQLCLSLDSFKNSFVGDFGTLSLIILIIILLTHPAITLWIAIRYSSTLQFKEG